MANFPENVSSLRYPNTDFPGAYDSLSKDPACSRRC
jgi:hypothetical protein